MLNWFRLGFGSAAVETSSLSHLPVDPPELAEVDFGEILHCDVRKVPGGQEVRSKFISSQINNQQTHRQAAADTQEEKQQCDLTSCLNQGEPAFQGSTSCSRDHEELVWIWWGQGGFGLGAPPPPTNPWTTSLEFGEGMGCGFARIGGGGGRAEGSS